MLLLILFNLSCKMKKVYFITGASSGLGKAIALQTLKNGNIAILAVRNREKVADIVTTFKDNTLVVSLDVTNEKERQEAIQTAIAKFGRIDVLVNCAGRGDLGALEEFSSEQIRSQMEINFFATIELTRLVLPIMRKQKSGNIVNISSIGGRVNIGGFALYGAAKYALEGFSEALYHEVKPLGIGVTIVEPGALRTNFAGAGNLRPENHINEYDDTIVPLRNYLYGSDGKQQGDPAKAAAVIIKAIDDKEPPLRLVLGKDAYDLLEAKRKEEKEELSKWRSLGEAIAFDDAKFVAIGEN